MYPVQSPKAQHRAYLTHGGVGAGTVFERQRMANTQRLDVAQKAAFEYQMPEEVVRQREALRRQQKGTNIVEARIQEAMVEGVFDNLRGKGKPLPVTWMCNLNGNSDG